MRTLFTALALLLAAGAAQADRYIFGSSAAFDGNGMTVHGQFVEFADQGAYFQNGHHQPDNLNYGVGFAESGELAGEYRNWFVLDLSWLFALRAAPIDSLSLTLQSFEVGLPAGGTYTLYDFGGSIDDLMSGAGGTAAFGDLGTGSEYGARHYTAADAWQVRTIELNGAALADLNQALADGDRYWAVGGRLVAGDLPPVPEPSTWALMLLGLGALRGLGRRR